MRTGRILPEGTLLCLIQSVDASRFSWTTCSRGLRRLVKEKGKRARRAIILSPRMLDLQRVDKTRDRYVCST